MDKRMKLIKKIDTSKDKKYKPTDKEIEEAYGYLDYCYNCGLRIYPGELVCHSIIGNCHRLGCSFTARMLGATLNTLKFIFLIPIILIVAIIYPFIILKRVLCGEKCGGW
jgi:hypothetical protein